MSEKGNNETDEVLTQIKAERAALKADLEKEKGISENAEKKFQEWAAERGKERKAIGDIAEGMAEETKKRHVAEEASDELAAKLRELEVKINEIEHRDAKEVENRNNQKTTEEKIQEITDNLTEEDLKVMDDAREKADPAIQQAIDSGGEVYLEFLNGLKEAKHVEESGRPPWRRNIKKPAAPSGDDDRAARMRKLFKREIEQANSYPDGTHGGGGARRPNSPPEIHRPGQKAVQKKWGIE